MNAAEKKVREHLKKAKYGYPSGNWGRAHDGLKHAGYAWRRRNVTR